MTTTTSREERLRAIAEEAKKLEAAISGLSDLLRHRYPELAPELDALQQAYDRQTKATARRPRAKRPRWENRAGDYFLMRDKKDGPAEMLAVAHRDGEQWRAMLPMKNLGTFPDAGAARKAIEQHLRVRPTPVEPKEA